MIKKLIYFILLTSLCGCNSSEKKYDYLYSSIEDKYDVTINYEYSDNIFPKLWKNPPISGKGHQIEPNEIKRMPPIIDTFLSKYSTDFVKKNLSNIYLLKKMYFYDKPYGGTSMNSSIYITNDERTENRLLGLIHSEFSSILLKNYRDIFPFQKWKCINDSNFNYIGSGLDIVGLKSSADQTEYLLSQGFIVRYGTSSVENDFNMYVDWIFTHPNEMKNYSMEYEKIKKKYEIVQKFYTDINSGVIMK